MIDHTTIEHDHQHKRHAGGDSEMNVVPHRIDTVLWSLRTDTTVGLVKTGKEKDVEVECNEHSYSTSDDGENPIRLIEPDSSETAERQVSVEADEHTQPRRRLSSSVADEDDRLA